MKNYFKQISIDKSTVFDKVKSKYFLYKYTLNECDRQQITKCFSNIKFVVYLCVFDKKCLTKICSCVWIKLPHKLNINQRINLQFKSVVVLQK